jgi:hypothetical protein
MRGAVGSRRAVWRSVAAGRDVAVGRADAVRGRLCPAPPPIEAPARARE